MKNKEIDRGDGLVECIHYRGNDNPPKPL